MIKIAPSILSADFARLGEEISQLQKLGADLIHIDVMDGHFVPNITFGPSLIKSIRPYSQLEFDVHLMINSPERYIKMFAQSGADIITIHYESTQHIEVAINLIKEFNKKAGISIKPETPVSVIEHLLHKVDLVLVMSVNPGFGGQKFIENSISKIKHLKTIKQTKGFSIDIEVDGGVNVENSSKIINAGANILVAGSTIYKSNDRKQVISTMKNINGEGRR